MSQVENKTAVVMVFNLNKSSENIFGTVSNKNFNTPFSNTLWDMLSEALDMFEMADSREDACLAIEKALTLIETPEVEAEFVEVKGYENCLVFNNKTNAYHLKANKVIFQVAFPENLCKRIADSIEKGIDCSPVIKAFTRFLRNPNFSVSKAENFGKFLNATFCDKALLQDIMDKEGVTYEVAKERATFPDVALTKEGLISCYKYAQIKLTKYDAESGDIIDRYKKSFDEETGEATLILPDFAEDIYFLPPVQGESGDAFTCGGTELGHRIKVGEVHRLPEWDMVNCNDNSTCVKGLHIGGRAYVDSYGGRDCILMTCFVDPALVGAFAACDNGTKGGVIRCKEYFVNNCCTTPTKGMYHSSKYAAMTDNDWTVTRAKSIEALNERRKALDTAEAELNAI